MLEGLVAWVLNNYLGKYVENLNTDQLSIALLSGEVELENLPLKKDALRHLGLPIEIKAGFIGKVKLQIPVRQIRSAPWVIFIEQLYLVASPLPVHEWDSVLEEATSHEIKLNALDEIEARWRIERESRDNSGYYASSYSSWLSFGTGLVTDIIENLQLKIHDVHLRYEDSFSVSRKNVGFGVTIESLSAQSCDSNWLPGFSHWDSSAASFKLLDLQKLAVYWVTLEDAELFSKFPLADLALAMSQSKGSHNKQYYILEPVCAEAHIKRNRSEQPLRSKDTPRIVCELHLEDVPLSLADWQYEQIVRCVRGLDDVTCLRNYRRFRPNCKIREDARAWWLYAISCQYPEKQPAICRPRPTWDSCLERARQNVAYVKLYSKVLATPAIALSPDQKKLKDDVEWNRDYDELKVLREISMRQVPTQIKSGSPNNSAGRSTLVRWFPQWMGWYSSGTTENTSSTASNAAELEGVILEALSDSIENNTLLKRDVVFGQFNFSLKSGSFNFCTVEEQSNNSVPMIELQFKNLSLNIVSRPRSSSHLVELSLGAMFLRDKLTLNTLFPVLVGPPDQERSILLTKTRLANPRGSVISRATEESTDPLFYLGYEGKPDNSACDYRLIIRSKSLDVVYQPSAIRWLSEFLFLPHQRIITQTSIEAMKSRTKREFIKNWEQILDGRLSGRKNWELELDISAPQIIFAEQFTDSNSAMAVIDFGRLQLRNNTDKLNVTVVPELLTKESEEDEAFMTPCSTPPGSEASYSETFSFSNRRSSLKQDELDEHSLHRKLYDSYCIELTDLQILIGRVKDNWRYAHNKGTSTLHVLDRFNISLQVERRVVHTCDPLFPSLTLSANLPKLVAHFNEHKIAAARSLIEIINATGLPSPFNTPIAEVPSTIVTMQEDDDSISLDTSMEMSRLLLFQFTVEQLALEVQSRGRSVAELQVSGVKAAFTKRHADISLTLTVHGLLLVDALQTFGPDFELLVASHKHVGMDSMSGSLRDSEPTSPTSPASPDPTAVRASATSPHALTQALSTLASTPPIALPWSQPSSTGKSSNVLDAEALIMIEVTVVTGLEPIHIANIQFNNLDIIANQETIVELIGFMQRVFPEIKPQKQSSFNYTPVVQPTMVVNDDTDESEVESEAPKICRTNVTFDFHRLNVLLLRGVVKDGYVMGKKIATATMSEAKIHATVDNGVVVEGSLGGLQVLDLTPGGHIHQRIISIGRDPMFETPHPLYSMSHTFLEEERKAFYFKVDRSFDSSAEYADTAKITIRMASVWYTHSPQFIHELRSCATEFKQYLANLARSIRSAATDMALGLVHARTEALVQSLYMNTRLSASLYGSALSLSEIMTPRTRSRRSISMESDGCSGYSSVRDTVPQTPYSPVDDDEFFIDMRLDFVFDSPVVVLPRAGNSAEVFVAHLGKISVSNRSDKESDNWQHIGSRVEHYDIEVRDMNLFSLDTSSRRVPGPGMNKAETLYSCETLAKPILHNTIVQLTIDREVFQDSQSRQHSLSNLLDDNDCNSKQNMGNLDAFNCENIQVSGSLVTDLKVSLTRTQYEQVLDTWQWLTLAPSVSSNQGVSRVSSRTSTALANISEEDTGVTTLKMDPHVRAKLFPAVGVTKGKSSSKRDVALKVLFELPVFTVELRGDSPNGEQGLVDLLFRDFIFNYEKCHRYETNIQVSLRSVIMEDLLQSKGSKQRAMVVSSSGGEPPNNAAGVSRSCPDISANFPFARLSHGSLPDHLEPARVLGINLSSFAVNADASEKNNAGTCPTPPPSPTAKERPQKNLVLISSLLVDPVAPNFKSYYNSIQRSTSIDFNCLDLIISVESWVVVIDFFSATPSAPVPSNINTNFVTARTDETSKIERATHIENTETNISVRSLTMALVRPDHDIAKANISHVDVSIKFNGLRQEIEGRLGSISLLDLTAHGQLYRERFVTSGKQALHFNYIRYGPKEMPDYDAQLKLKMSSVMYVHTKRFMVELQAFYYHFYQLQAVMSSIRAAAASQKISDEHTRLSIVLEAGAPVILLPVSSESSDLLIADLGRLVLTNRFQFAGESGTISVVNGGAAPSGKICLMDVMSVELQNVDLYTGVRMLDTSITKTATSVYDCMDLGSYVVGKKGISLLTEKCHLKIQVERNLDSDLSHCVPDMSMNGELSTLDIALDLSQYRLIRDFLTNNLGENTEHILPSVPATPTVSMQPNTRELWTLSSLRFDLLNVILRLEVNHKTAPLARINFIKSRLTVESFSNLSQDVDLVSQEILIMDTRFQDVPVHQRSNVFTNILQPIHFESKDETVQAEVHSRKREDRIKFTILLNNMRLMAVFDWWEAAREFILEDYQVSQASFNTEDGFLSGKGQELVPLELKLNITDSEIVVVENTSQWDTNAVILKSTTVLSYKPYVLEKPLSCNLNNCEMYSCVLGMEDETALSIIDPVTLNMEINKERALEVHLHILTIRLSYYDMKMFLKILNSLPKQMLRRKFEEAVHLKSDKSDTDKLVALGFAKDDCIRALAQSENKLDDAALWLTQNAIPVHSSTSSSMSRPQPFALTAVEVKAGCISLCIIDDCGDADVPLLEISLTQLSVNQRLDKIQETCEDLKSPEGALECVLTSDYYNRVLSGWEPIVEPWKCLIVWDHVLTTNLSKNRLQINIESQDLLNINITSTLTELYQQVKASWMQDYYNLRDTSDNVNAATPAGYKRRSPFVPFALKNDTGSPLHFTTLIANAENTACSERSLEVTERWVLVAPGETVPFTFKSRDKMRHRDSHKLRMHQLGIKVEGWKPVTPVTVDKVGIYFRHAAAEMQHRNEGIPQARIVFDVALEGSARKLVTVRSALQIINKLQETAEIKLERPLTNAHSVPTWANSTLMLIPNGGTLAVPLIHVYSQITVRPNDSQQMYTYCAPHVFWGQVTRSLDSVFELKNCHTRPDQVYRFCTEIKRENYPQDRASSLMSVSGQFTQPAHTITLLPTVLLVNLLPMDLNYKLEGACGRVPPGSEATLTNINTENVVKVALNLENFPESSGLVVPAGCVTGFTCRVRFQDISGRKLYLLATITPNIDAKVKIILSAPYWINNKTGLPLVFRQGGVSAETAGQFDEHELCRMAAPLLFSFSDPDASPTVVARIGNHLITNGSPQWSQNFHLQRGMQVKRLRVTLRDGRPDVVFLVGIEVRNGHGRYRSTSIVTISPRFQLYNKSSYNLLFAQSCFATTVTDPMAQTTYLKAVPDCHMAFHWPHLDKDQHLCVLIQDIPDCCWSGGLIIDTNDSMHINIRDIHGRMYFLRMEVVLQGATYFIVFTDADTMPPPIRIDNFSEVPVTFAQSCCKDTLRSIARAHTSVPYAWDQPTGQPCVTIVAPGGISNKYDMNKLGTAPGLTYENFIYIAFTGTFKNEEENFHPLDVENQQLVLDVVNGCKIVLAHKQPGQRSQLWRMTASGQLQHEGSSPPSHPQHPRTENILVLDIEGPAPQPTSYTRLMLRRPDPRRRSTQTWRFTDDGRLCCAHFNMCVQAQDGFFGLRQGGRSSVANWQQWNAAVLGLPQPICHRVTNWGIPLEQAVSRQRLRPGSGFLSVEIRTDGPTRVLIVRDMKEKHLYAMSDERDWCHISVNQRPNLLRDEEDANNKEAMEVQFIMRLEGVGVSVVTRKPCEELLFAKFGTIISDVVLSPVARTLCVSVKDIQCDNQLLSAAVPVVLYVTPLGSRGADQAQYNLPALEIKAEIQPTPNENAVIFKHLIVRLKKMTIPLEERLLLKLFAFIGARYKDEELCNNLDESDFETQKMLTEVSATHAKRYYFGIIQLLPDQIRLSMKTSSKLPPQLQAIKGELGIPFIKFEDAAVDLEPFVRRHPFETSQFLFHSIIKHFKDELMWQAGIILGSVDFLGNPLGFMNDVSEGFSGLIYEGSVGSFVKNVAHGISNSAAKVTESLSDGLGRVTMDEEHEEMRQRIRQVDSGRSGDHIVAGIKGFSFGVLGGMTGIFKQVYDGAANEGIQGAFSGIGKGLVGAVAKPVVGVLDLASETARAVRDSSRSSTHIAPDRSRLPRCALGPGRLLPRYNRKQSLGQQYLYTINNRNYSEELVAYEYLRGGSDDLKIIVSNQRVRVVTSSNTPSLTTVIETHLSDLQQCQPVSSKEAAETRYYIEIIIRVVGTTASLAYQEPIKKPRVRCDSLEIAQSVAQRVNYAKRLYDEMLHTLTNDNTTLAED